MKLKLLIYPDDRLKQKSIVVDEEHYDADITNTVFNCMDEYLDRFIGIGFSAPQIDCRVRMIITMIQVSSSKIFMINPIITIPEEAVLLKGKEGCLSVPGYFDDVYAYNQISCSYFDFKKQKEIEKRFYGIDARVIQHEVNHLEGKLFIDDLSPLKTERIRRKIKSWTRKNRSKLLE